MPTVMPTAMPTVTPTAMSLTLQSPLDTVGLLIRQDDRSPHSYDRSASFIHGRYGTEYISVLHLILPVRGRIVIGKSSKQPLLDQFPQRGVWQVLRQTISHVFCGRDVQESHDAHRRFLAETVPR
jgi:hypothetical protein